MEATKSNKINMCMQCGMCTGSCPEAGITPLNIRKQIRRGQLEHSIDKTACWYCTSCGECLIRCPRDVKPLEYIIGIRSSLVEEGKVPVSIQKALENCFIQKNPWGRPKSGRGAWMDDLEMEIPHVSETESGRLLFICCIQAYDPECMVIPVNLAKIFREAKLDFGVLGAAEVCCGSEIRRMGEEGLFEELEEENIAAFEKYGVKEIITLSPHCMNTLKNEYNPMGVKVYHYTEVLASMVKEGSIKFDNPFEKKVIYHDPCFLGKQNKIFSEPRSILTSIEGLELLEFSQSRENSLCCEGGGGRMFYDSETAAQRTSEKRVQEAIDKGAEVLTTSCPFCFMTLQGPASERGLNIMELSEIVAVSMHG